MTAPTAPGASPGYFIRLRGQVKGPYSVEQLVRMASRGQFSRLYQVSTNQTEWTSAGELKEVFAAKTPVAAPEPDPVVTGAGAKEWFYNSGDSKIGPVDEAFIKNLIVSGKIDGGTLLWKSGLPNWLEARQFFPNAFGKPSRMTGAKWAALAVGILLLIGGGVGAAYKLGVFDRISAAMADGATGELDPGPSDSEAETTLAYWTLLGDELAVGGSTADDLEAKARAIDSLAVSDVDQEVVAFALQVSTYCRDIASFARQQDDPTFLLDAFLRGAQGDPLGVARETLDAVREIKARRGRLLSQASQMRATLSRRHGREFPVLGF